ncbi:hypothetical protein [Adlercreutzia caecimuris]|uniref:Uncharacterized protein n=1 Tax=Adlercreutzia caecimuris TaxID=671266 RepID=A0A4S4G1L8_9ACTN|nr:hypothetical protein [Adlercreutzia caecimuris]THG36854.1 hypothetical protein E5986_08105 [Adlercreutzia caecimuris]
MEAVLFVPAAIIFIVLICLAIAALAFIGSIAVLSLYALVKPHISSLLDAWNDWFDRRTGC